MAYDDTITIDRRMIGGVATFLITVTETEAAAGSEYEITRLPTRCTLLSTRSTLTSLGVGTGVTIQPRFGVSASWTDGDEDERAVSLTPGASVVIRESIHLDLSTGSLFGRSTVDAGADNSITTVLRFAQGWV